MFFPHFQCLYLGRIFPLFPGPKSGMKEHIFLLISADKAHSHKILTSVSGLLLTAKPFRRPVFQAFPELCPGHSYLSLTHLNPTDSSQPAWSHLLHKSLPGLETPWTGLPSSLFQISSRLKCPMTSLTVPPWSHGALWTQKMFRKEVACNLARSERCNLSF